MLSSDITKQSVVDIYRFDEKEKRIPILVPDMLLSI